MKKPLHESLTPAEIETKEAEIEKLKTNKREFVKRYGKDAEKVMYAISVKRAKKKSEDEFKQRIKETIKSILHKPKNDSTGT